MPNLRQRNSNLTKPEVTAGYGLNNAEKGGLWSGCERVLSPLSQQTRDAMRLPAVHTGGMTPDAIKICLCKNVHLAVLPKAVQLWQPRPQKALREK